MKAETAIAEDDDHEDDNGWIQDAVRSHQASLIRYATRLLGDPDRARDVVQDTFVKLMGQTREQVDGHLVEWLFTVCRHRAVDVGRKEGRMMRFDERTAATEMVTADPRPGRDMEAAETQASVLQLIQHLPENQQEVIRLKFQNGFSYKEISRITQLSVTNVGFLIHTAVSRLRTEMAAAKQ